MSLPEEVFAKNDQAAIDFLNIIEIMKQDNDHNQEQIAHYYLQTGICYENMGNKEEADFMFLNALSQHSMDIATKYQLLKKGYLAEESIDY